MKGKILEQIKPQLYLVELEGGRKVKASIGLKPLVLVFGGKLDVNQIVRIKLTSINTAVISPRDIDGL